MLTLEYWIAGDMPIIGVCRVVACKGQTVRRGNVVLLLQDAISKYGCLTCNNPLLKIILVYCSFLQQVYFM